jgi:hypothetical protein
VALALTFENTQLPHEAADIPSSSKPESLAKAPPTHAAITTSLTSGHGWFPVAGGAVGLVSFDTKVFLSIRSTTTSDDISNFLTRSSSDHSDAEQVQRQQRVLYGIAAGAATTSMFRYQHSSKLVLGLPTVAQYNVSISPQEEY